MHSWYALHSFSLPIVSGLCFLITLSALSLGLETAAYIQNWAPSDRLAP